MAMTPLNITQYRMTSQQISGTHIKKPADMVHWLGAIQAQEYALSKWGIGLRLPGCTDEDVENALTSGDILRTHLLRPTWHFVTPADIRWMLTLTAPRVNLINGFMYRKMELDNKIFKRTNDLFIKELQGNKQLTRATLQAMLKRKKITADGIRLSCIVMRAELDGIICSGAREGNQFTYALLEERVPVFKKMNEDEALVELTKRYFRSRGPATIRDFSVWSGLTTGQAKKGIGIVSADFTQEKKGAENYYFQQAGLPGKNILPKAWLLPPYDEYIMGYKNKDDLFFKRNKMKPLPRLLFDNTIVIGGQVAGSWRRTVQKNFIDLEYHLFEPSNKKQLTAVKQAIKKFSAFTALPVQVKN